MSTHPAPAFTAQLSGPKPAGAAWNRMLTGMSLTGPVLFLIGLLVVGSGFSALRPNIMGLALHPFLIPAAFAFPLVIMARLGDFPVRVMVSLLVFCGVYFISIFNGASISVSELFKVSASFMTMVTCALLVRRRGDFVAGVLGLTIAVALLAARGLQA